MRETIALRERQRQDDNLDGISIELRQRTLIAEQQEAVGIKTGWQERTRRGMRELFVPGFGWLERPEIEEEEESDAGS